MMYILWAFLILLGLGLLFGFGLAIASTLLYVKEDERIEEIEKLLPNYNCGSCGYAGCKDFATAIVNKEVKDLRKCKPGMKGATYENIRKYLDEHPNDKGEKIEVVF